MANRLMQDLEGTARLAMRAAGQDLEGTARPSASAAGRDLELNTLAGGKQL